MRYLHHDSGEATELRNSQVLGDDSPLQFDEEGRAGPLEDDVAEKVSAMHRHVSLGERARESVVDEFDAEAFVDRTPMSNVVEDIESGDYDEHLEEIEAAAERVGVQDAVDERRE